MDMESINQRLVRGLTYRAVGDDDGGAGPLMPTEAAATNERLEAELSAIRYALLFYTPDDDVDISTLGLAELAKAKVAGDYKVIVEVSMTTEIESTKRILVASQRWKDSCEKLDLMAIARSAPLDLASWGIPMHHTVRAWASGHGDEVPAVLSDYFDGIKGAA